MNSIVDPRLLQPDIAFIKEDAATVLSRYRGFGRDFLTNLFSDNKELEEGIVFLKDADTDDVWAYYKNGTKSFGFQIDPDCEVIILWNSERNFIEIGNWADNPINEALTIVMRYLHDRI